MKEPRSALGVPQRASPMLGGILRNFTWPPGTEAGLLPPLAPLAGRVAAPQPSSTSPAPAQAGRQSQRAPGPVVCLDCCREFCSLESFFGKGGTKGN